VVKHFIAFSPRFAILPGATGNATGTTIDHDHKRQPFDDPVGRIASRHPSAAHSHNVLGQRTLKCVPFSKTLPDN
jgi:hypothetical protein